MEKETLYQFESLCVQDEPPACQTTCPLHLDARAFIAQMAAGKYDEARKILDKVMPLSVLTGRLCAGPCRAHCRRSELDEGIDLPLLERLCVARGRSARVMPLPGGSKKVLVFGAGLASLTLAWEQARKGVAVTVRHLGPIGGTLNRLPPERLPQMALPEALNQLKNIKVRFEEVEQFTPDDLNRGLDDNLAVFLGFDDPALTAESLGLTESELTIDPLTLTTPLEKTLAWKPNQAAGFIADSAAGKRAAGSIVRLAQGVPPSSAREGEAVYPTRLYTNLAGVEIRPQAAPVEALAPTEEEAQTEAERCIQCQCLECVKHCVYLKHYNGYPKKLARETYNNIATAFGIRASNTMILSCAECGLCGAVCPNGCNMADFIPLARREMVEVRHMPVSAHEFALEDLLFSNSPEISFWRHEPKRDKSRWLFFPGCQLPASMPENVISTYEYLRRRLKGGVGFMMACCGAPARWSGRPVLTSQVRDNFKKNWLEAGQPRMILACASCALFFKAELPETPFETLWNILAALPPPERAVTTGVLTLHDPCAARHDLSALAAVRAILKRSGQPFEEMPANGQKTKCCGYGGLADEANREVGDKFIADRAGESGRPILAHCVMCRDRLRKNGGPTLHLLDLMFPAVAPEEAAMRPYPSISDRQEGRAAFSRRLLKELWNQRPPMDELMNKDIVLNISPELETLMDRRRILRRDIAAVLNQAENEGSQFINPDSGRKLTSYRPKQVTFWVEYSEKDDGSFDIHDVYCHRMVVQGVPGEGADTAASREGFDPLGGRR